MNRLTKYRDDIEAYDMTGVYAGAVNEMCQKLGKFEDLEEQIGCSLEIVFQALKNGIYVKNSDDSLEYHNVSGIELNALSVIDNLAPYPECDEAAYYKDYKKTWWLKKDKSE